MLKPGMLFHLRRSTGCHATRAAWRSSPWATKHGTYKTVKARFWPWLSDQCPETYEVVPSLQIDRLSRDPRGLALLAAAPNALSSMLTILEVMSPQFEFLKLFVLVHMFAELCFPVHKRTNRTQRPLLHAHNPRGYEPSIRIGETVRTGAKFLIQSGTKSGTAMNKMAVPDS